MPVVFADAIDAVASPVGAGLPLIHPADTQRILAWHRGRAIDVATFLGDVAHVGATLPAAPAVVNLCQDRYAFLVAFCAIACHGQANLLPPSRAPKVVAETLAAYPGSYALADAEPSAGMPPLLRLPALGLGAHVPDMPMLPADQIVAIGFTSGSTGRPKANPKTWGGFHASTALNVDALTRIAGWHAGAQAHVVATVPPQHMYGLEMSVLLPLLGGFVVHAAQPLFPADVAAALAEVPEPRVLITTPVHLRALLRESRDLPPLAAIASATAPLTAELAGAVEARYGAPVLEFFGSTETCVIAERRSALDSHWRLYDGVTLHPQPDGTQVEAAHLAAPVNLPDLVELLPDAHFRLCGRHADFIDIAGKRASLEDLSLRVLALDGVQDAVVFQLDSEDSMGVRRIAALVVAPTRSESELMDELRLAIDPAFLPRPMRKVAALPRNDTGKLPRAALLAALSDVD